MLLNKIWQHKQKYSCPHVNSHVCLLVCVYNSPLNSNKTKEKCMKNEKMLTLKYFSSTFLLLRYHDIIFFHTHTHTPIISIKNLKVGQTTIKNDDKKNTYLLP